MNVKAIHSGLFAVAAVASFAAGSSVHAAPVNFSIPGYSGPGADTNGVTPEAWNTINQNGATADAGGITLNETQGNIYYGGPNPGISLFKPYAYLDNRQNTSPDNISLSNVPVGFYDLYLYGTNGGYNDSGTTFTVTGSGIGGTPTTSAADVNVQSATFVAGDNYVLIPVIVGIGGSTITASYAPGPNPAKRAGGNPEADFNGLQLVSVLPEPASLSLVALGASGLLARRRRA